MNLIEGIQNRCNRGRELIKVYDTMPMGWVEVGWIKTNIKEGEDSIASGDIVKMLLAFKGLESCK